MVSCRNYLGKPKWIYGRVSKKLRKLHYLIKLDNGKIWKRHVNHNLKIEENVENIQSKSKSKIYRWLIGLQITLKKRLIFWITGRFQITGWGLVFLKAYVETSPQPKIIQNCILGRYIKWPPKLKNMQCTRPA